MFCFECTGDHRDLTVLTPSFPTRRSSVRRVTVGIALSEWHPAQFAQDIFAVTAGKACDENAAITLADRKTGRAIGMRGAQTHGGAAMPGTAESTNEIDEFLGRSDEHTSELQSLMRISYAVFCLKKKKKTSKNTKSGSYCIAQD